MLIKVIGFLVILCLEVNNAEKLPDGCEHKKELSVVKKKTLDKVICNSAGLGLIPRDFPNSIDYLDIDNDVIENLTAADFQAYAKIKYLKLTHLSISHIAKDTFVNMELETINLGGNHIDHLPVLPSSLETLYVDQMTRPKFFSADQTVANVKALKSLKMLSMKHNRLVSFPIFVKELTSLTDLDISKNQINRLTVEDIVPLCSLKDMAFGDNAIARTKDAACECVGVQAWALKNKINIYNLTCPQVSGIDEEACKRNAESRANDMRYHQCSIWRYWPHVVGVLVVIVILILCWCCWSYLKGRKATSTKAVAKYFAGKTDEV